MTPKRGESAGEVGDRGGGVLLRYVSLSGDCSLLIQGVVSARSQIQIRRKSNAAFEKWGRMLRSYKRTWAVNCDWQHTTSAALSVPAPIGQCMLFRDAAAGRMPTPQHKKRSVGSRPANSCKKTLAPMTREGGVHVLTESCDHSATKNAKPEFSPCGKGTILATLWRRCFAAAYLPHKVADASPAHPRLLG